MSRRTFPRSNEEWLLDKRNERAAEIESLKMQLNEVSAMPFELRRDRLDVILRQAAGAFDEIDHIDELLAHWCGRQVAKVDTIAPVRVSLLRRLAG